MSTVSIRVESIVIGERHRALSEDAVKRLTVSMREIGLRSPITVRVADDHVLPDGEVCDGVPLLVAGAHRLAAAKALGWSHIDCIDVDDDEITAELWEIAENLHRLDLTKEQRDEHIRRYADLLETKRQLSDKLSNNPAPVGRPKSVATEVAENTGLSARTVRRALNPPPQPTSRPQLVEVKDGFDAIAAQADAIVRAWNRACPEARQLAMEQIDEPVFERTRAAG